MTHAEDLELLHALQVAPRASWRAIGTALHRSPAAIASRWDELSSAGLAWCTAVPVSTAQRGSLIFVAVRGEPGHRQSLIDESIQIPEVISVEEPASHWDLILTVVAPGFDEFVSRIRPKIAGLDGIARLDTIICTRLHFGGHDWRLDALTPQAKQDLERVHHFARGEEQRVRDEDRALLPVLFRDGRAGVGEIAEELGTHPSTISRRLSRLLASPKVTLRCEVSAELLGQSISCQWFCWIPPERHDHAASVLRSFPGLRFCGSTTGQTNFTFVIWMTSATEIFDLEYEIVERIGEIAISESSVTVRFIKRIGWLLDERGRRQGKPIVPVFRD